MMKFYLCLIHDSNSLFKCSCFTFRACPHMLPFHCPLLSQLDSPLFPFLFQTPA